MGGKGKGKPNKGPKTSRTQQQQQAAAKRGAVIPRTASPNEQRTGPAMRRPVTTVPAPALLNQAPPVQVNHYLDVSAVRIQEWLGRTPDLAFRRGASVLLSEATARKAWQDGAPIGTSWNREAGDVDGVVSLVLDDPGADPAFALAEAARQVVGRMRESMPHCQIQAVAGEGESYSLAYQGMAKARRDGDFLIDLPPAPGEAILAKPCDQCRAAAATKDGVVSGERKVDLCAECNARSDAAGRTAGRPDQAPEPEQRLRRALAEAGMHVTDFSDAFADMAAAGRRDRDDAATQLALIYADGNQVGRFLMAAATAPGGPDRATIAPLLVKATLGALARAVIDRFCGAQKPPVLVNLAGGDDLLVSVPAADGWLFTVTLITAFREILAGAASGWPDEARRHVPSLSAGLVFHHVKFPFSDAVRLAAAQLHLAKARERGKAAVAFLDLTTDGNEPPAGRDPVTLDYLQRHATRLQQTADLPASRRHTLIDRHRNGKIDEFIDRLADLPNDPLWEIAAGHGADPSKVRKALDGDPARQAEVCRVLDIARHWHAAPHTAVSGESEA